MKTGDEQRLGALVAGTAEAFGRSFTKAALRIWWRALAHYDLADVERAFNAHLRGARGTFMPVPADIIRLIDGDPEAREIGAWDKAIGAVSRHGSYASVCFDDPAITAAIKSGWGDWPTFCQLPEKERNFTERRFREHYRAALSNRPRVRYLAGQFEAMNGGRYGREAVALIGDRERAMALLGRDAEELADGFRRIEASA